MVQYLLKDAHCNPNCTNKAGRTPLGVTSGPKISKQLIKYGANPTDVYSQYSKELPQNCPKQPAESAVKVLIVGRKEAGKSTLTKALCQESKGFSRLANWVVQVTGVDSKTAGIIPYDVQSDQLGNLTLYDFAGHQEYYPSHGAFVRSTTSRSSTAAFLIVADMRLSDEEFKSAIAFWLQFISTECTHCTGGLKPHIVVVGSRADQLKSSDVTKKQKAVTSLLPTFTKLHYVAFVAIDCRYSVSTAMSQLRQHLATSCETLRNKVEMSFNCHCFFVYLLDKYRDCTAVPLRTILAKTTEDKHNPLLTFIPENDTGLCTVCEELNERGNIFFLKNASNLEASWIILEKEVLLSQVTGTVFAPEGFKEHLPIATSTGVVPFRAIADHFRGHDPQMITAFLTHLEFCHEITDPEALRLLQVPKSSASTFCSEKYLFFPALVSIEAPGDVWETDYKFVYQSGWVLQCSQLHEFFTPRYLQVLLVRLAFSFALALEQQVDHPALHRKCSVWKNGIYWANRDGVECLVEVTNAKLVNVMLRCLKGNEIECVHLRSLVIHKVLNALEQLCPDISTSEMIIHPSSVSYPLKLDDKRTQYNLHEIATAVCEAKPSVVNESRKVSTLEELLYFEPYAQLGERILHELFSEEKPHCDKEVTDEFLYRIADQVHEKKEKFVKLFKSPATMLHERIREAPPGPTHEIARVFQLWRTCSDGTYQCLRKELDQFSVFGGRNPLTCRTFKTL